MRTVNGYFVKITPFLILLLFLGGEDPSELFGGRLAFRFIQVSVTK